MKKFVILAIILDLLIIFIAYNAFQNNYLGDENQRIVDISKLVLQSTVTGVVTFTGLLLTIFSQDNQSKRKEQLKLCACLIIKNSSGASASKDITCIKNNPKVIVCDDKPQIRTVECMVENCKKNYALNLSIESVHGEVKLGTIKDECRNIQLALKKEETGELVFKFEDIYGLKYKQKIVYEYQQHINTFQFISKQPKRRFL